MVGSTSWESIVCVSWEGALLEAGESACLTGPRICRESEKEQCDMRKVGFSPQTAAGGQRTIGG